MSRLSYYCEMLNRMHPWHAMPKVWNYAKYRCYPRKATMSLSRYTPQIAGLLLTTRCNLHCGYCSVARVMQQNKEAGQEVDIDLEKTKRIFSNPLFARCLLVDLLGGEPLLVRDIDRIIAYLAGRGHIINTSTNGLLLADRVAELKKAGVSRINVSLYDANRSAMERDLEKINRVFPVHTSIVLVRSDIENHREKILSLVRCSHESGCRSLRFWIYRPMGANPQPQEVISETHPAYLDFRQEVEKAFAGFCFWPPAIQTKVVKKRCPQLWQRILCDSLGRITICCGTDNILQGPQSNLFCDDPALLWNHSTFVTMRQQLLDPNSEPPQMCKNCNLLGEPGW